MSAHVPGPRTWDCVACGAEWPCRTRRTELRAEYRGALPELRAHLAGCLVPRE